VELIDAMAVELIDAMTVELIDAMTVALALASSFYSTYSIFCCFSVSTTSLLVVFLSAITSFF